ncbi:MAG: hypothetical protein ACLU99_14680 [Alphaproteobacteria bacterium]
MHTEEGLIPADMLLYGRSGNDARRRGPAARPYDASSRTGAELSLKTLTG